MTIYKFDTQEDIQNYFKVLARSANHDELEMHRQVIYKILFHDQVKAHQENDIVRIEMYQQGLIDLSTAVLEIKKKIYLSEGTIKYRPKHRKKTHV